MAFTSGENWRVAFNWHDSASGGNAVNVIGIATTAITTPAAVFACIDAHVAAAMFDWPAVSAAVVTVDVADLAGVLATQTFSTGTPAKWTGGGTGQSVPQVAGIVKLQTGLAGRSHRGRIFLPFVGEGENTFGQLSDAPAVETAWNGFANGISGDATTPATLCVTSKKLATQFVVHAITAEVASATQRRRMGRLR